MVFFDIKGPYLMEKRKSLGPAENQKALLTFDVFKGQKTERVMDTLKVTIVW